LPNGGRIAAKGADLYSIVVSDNGAVVFNALDDATAPDGDMIGL
jgi:hypothetical protein